MVRSGVGNPVHLERSYTGVLKVDRRVVHTFPISPGRYTTQHRQIATLDFAAPDDTGNHSVFTEVRPVNSTGLADSTTFSVGIKEGCGRRRHRGDQDQDQDRHEHDHRRRPSVLSDK